VGGARSARAQAAFRFQAMPQFGYLQPIQEKPAAPSEENGQGQP
jgi:hypothetical protein